MLDITFGNIKAGDGNRTHVSSLEGWCSTIELHPHEVGVTGFEPATSWSQTRRSSQAEPHPEGYLFASVSSVTQVVLYYRVSKMSTLFSNFFNYFFNFYNLITEPLVRQGVLCLSVLSPISFLPYNSFTRSSFIARSALPL